MLKNYFEVEQDLSMKGFLKEIKEKKNSHYIILNTEPVSFVDIRTVALKISNLNEKLKGLKKTIAQSTGKNEQEHLNFLIESGDRVVKVNDEYYSFIEALQEILNLDPSFLEEEIDNIDKKEIYAINEDDKISSARNLFLQKRVNILPVIEGLKVIGELRPIDLLVTHLYDPESENSNYYNEKYKDNVLNLSITNLINTRPITLSKDKKIKQLVEIMVNKKLPSIIITDNENLYSIISYKDIFKLYKKDIEKSKYIISYVGGSDLYEDEFDLIQDYAEKSMKKISKISKYDDLKLSFKVIGEKDASHQKKIEAKLLLSHGNNVIQIEKQIIEGTSDEEFNDKVKGKWNVPQLVQEALSVLEKKVKDEKDKK